MIRAAHRNLLLVVLFALGLRLILWAQPLHQPANDEVEYIAVAQDLLAGRGWVFYASYHWLRAPLYPLFLAGSLALAGGDLHLAALANVLLSTLSVLLAALLARRMVGEHATIPAAVLTALLWTNATFASLYMSETLCTVLIQAGLLVMLPAPILGSGSGVREKPGLRGLPSVALAGILLGLAVLTRSAVLPLVGLLGCWLFWRGRMHWRAGLAPALVLGVATICTIAPWSIRNTLAYGQFIAVETGLAYNTWVFNEPRATRDEIHRALAQIANPAERAAFATAQGTARLREDPTILARKLWPNWVYLVRVKPIQDRFLQQSYYSDIQLPLFAAALIFDDGLYLLIAAAALAGLATGRTATPGARGLVLAWCALAVGTMLVTHGEARYRHFFFPLLIPFAAGALADLRGLRVNRLLAVAALVIFLLLFVPLAAAYPREWAATSVMRGGQVLLGDLALARGDATGALGHYTSALASEQTADGELRRAAAHAALGDRAAQERALRRAWDLRPLYYVASARFGDLLRQQGRISEAREAFDGQFVDERQVLDWSWRNLRPTARATLAIGDGLDFGDVRGVEPAEIQQGLAARWSSGHAEVRLAPEAAGARVVRVLLAAPQADATPVTICVADVCRGVNIGRGWRWYAVPITLRGPAIVTIRSDTFAATDGRMLGVLIGAARLR